MHRGVLGKVSFFLPHLSVLSCSSPESRDYQFLGLSRAVIYMYVSLHINIHIPLHANGSILHTLFCSFLSPPAPHILTLCLKIVEPRYFYSLVHELSIFYYIAYDLDTQFLLMSMDKVLNYSLFLVYRTEYLM